MKNKFEDELEHKTVREALIISQFLVLRILYIFIYNQDMANDSKFYENIPELEQDLQHI